MNAFDLWLNLCSENWLFQKFRSRKSLKNPLIFHSLVWKKVNNCGVLLPRHRHKQVGVVVWQVVGAIIGTLHLHPFWLPPGHSLEKVMHLSNWWVTSQQAFCTAMECKAHSSIENSTSLFLSCCKIGQLEFGGAKHHLVAPSYWLLLLWSASLQSF